MDTRLLLQLLNDLVCPACSEGLAAAHADGNQKLFTWDRNREPFRTPHYPELFLQDQAVKRTLDALDIATRNKVSCRLLHVFSCCCCSVCVFVRVHFAAGFAAAVR